MFGCFEQHYVEAFASVVSLPQGVFFEDLLFPQILDFEILMGLRYFLDINHLIWYGFSWFLVFSWVLIGLLSYRFKAKKKSNCGSSFFFLA